MNICAGYVASTNDSFAESATRKMCVVLPRGGSLALGKGNPLVSRCIPSGSGTAICVQILAVVKAFETGRALKSDENALSQGVLAAA